MRTVLTSMITLCAVACAARSSAVKSDAVAANPSPLPFIENDYGRALQEAQAKKLPIFVDAWAPW